MIIMKKSLFLFISLFICMCLQSEFVFSQVQNEMIRIEGGTFLMGSPEDEFGRSMTDEEPQHRVTVKSFFIAKYPVTQAEYQAVTSVNPSQTKNPAHPVDSTNWFDAVNYCNRRSAAEGLTPAYTVNGAQVTWNREADGYRLPTEAEWEYACRAGTVSPFYSGNTMHGAGWFNENSFTTVNGFWSRHTHPVGQKEPNAWGLYDMHGNILEWCWDWMSPYTAEPKHDPIGPATGHRRIYRGGCFDSGSSQCRSAYRFGQTPYLGMFYMGFRIARNDF